MSFLDLINSLFGSKPKPPAPGKPSTISDSPDEPAQITNPKVLLIIYNPTLDAAAGKKLCETMNWPKPDVLAGQFISDVLQVSGGLARYQIAQRVELDEFPALVDGFRYTPQAYLDVVRNGKPAHNPQGLDYQAILKQFNILQRVANKEIDEVWVMGFPYAGLYESTMGGAGAFWCNAPPLTNTNSCPRRFIIMGFSYEREVGEMLHSYNHRCESIMAQAFHCQDFLTWTYKTNRTPATINPDQALNVFQRFILFDQIAPGKAAVGTVHYAPNGVKDYDLGNPNPVKSECYDWLNYPNFKGDIRTVTAQDWGGTEESYQQWWLNHMPKTAGRKNGIHNNWWQYVANPNNVMV